MQRLHNLGPAQRRKNKGTTVPTDTFNAAAKGPLVRAFLDTDENTNHLPPMEEERVKATLLTGAEWKRAVKDNALVLDPRHKVVEKPTEESYRDKNDTGRSTPAL